MNREAFIRRLRELLAGLPQNEAAEAIQYYEDYFADAGEENEAKVIEELGSPEKVAANIRADLGMAGSGSYAEDSGSGGYAGNSGSGGYTGNGGSSGYAGSSNGEYTGGRGNGSYAESDSRGGRAYGGAYDGGDRRDGISDRPKEKHTALWIVLAIATFYIWLPLLFVAVILIFVAVIVVLALSFAFGVTAFALGVAGIALVGIAFARMFLSPAGGLVLLGGGLLAVGVTIFCIWLVGMLFGRALPAFFRAIGAMIRRARGKRGETR
ncbi:MAG: DUF1700 domain-containing protein [bacterium]|nr:DUF1700 domain-containing protein [bacterium]